MVRNSESGVQRRHLFAQTLELVLCPPSTIFQLTFTYTTALQGKLSQDILKNTRERNHRASWSFSSTNELMEVGMWLHSPKI